MENINKEEIVKSLQIVKNIIGDEHQIVDYFYSGDKDTYRSAVTDVLAKYGLPGFYESSREDLELNCEKYSIEINEEYERSVNYGKTKMDELNILLNYINEKLEFYNEVKDEEI
jgi:hypothetical protein